MGRGISGHEKPYEGSTNVWLTPKGLIDALGPFDCDPCAAEPRPFDIATVNYTEADNGLSKQWNGFVWCNPPYGPWVGAWLERMREHGNGIALVFARTDTKAMQTALHAADAVFFLAGRLTCEGVELYPAESRLMNLGHCYHLWVLTSPGARFPFGVPTRAVAE